MLKKSFFLPVLFIFFFSSSVFAQYTPWFYWTFLPENQMNEIIGEASGETAWNNIMETGGYNRDRLPEEYRTTFFESQYVLNQLKQYGLPGAEIVRFPAGEVWDGIKGELWEIEPMKQKLASFQDMRAMLAKGSNSADVTAELVWVGRGTKKEIDDADVDGKIVVTEGRINSAHNFACIQHKALGVIAISASRPYFDPLQIPWSGIGSRRRRPGENADSGKAKFGFFLPVREGDYLKKRLLSGQKIKVHAVVKTTMQPYEYQDVTCHISGTDPNAGEIIFSAHLFEGIIKQGANDNISGSMAILEVARVLHTLIEEGRLPRPKRTIRFIWGAEFSGIGPWVKANKDLMEKTLCDINMDMVGEYLSKNKAFMELMRTTYGNPHYINDVVENYYRFVGEGNRERIQNRSSFFKVPHRIVAPSGADEPFYYSIETHYGSSDHEIFNDWSVDVPGVMMIAWPDQWYHTSGDRVDKADPTQLKRVVVIGAASAYTIANADDDMAVKIAGEITSNASRRLGHQFAVALETMNQAAKENFSDAYKEAQNCINAATDNEIATLASVLELANDRKKVGVYVTKMQKSVRQIAKTHLSTLATHMKTVAIHLNTKPARVTLTKEEKRAAKIIPEQTAKVKEMGYAGFRGVFELINKIPREEKDKYPYNRREVGSTSELQALINGGRSVLDIRNALDAQYPGQVKLQSVMNYLQILKLAGLVQM